jgi:hypothetical protein
MDYSIANRTPDVAEAVVGHFVDANGNAVPQSAAQPLPVASLGAQARTPASVAWQGIVSARALTVGLARQQLVGSMLDALYDSGAWGNLDFLWFFGMENPAAALVDLIRGQAATPVAAPLFTAGQGYTFNGTTQYLNTGVNASTAKTMLYAQNDASMGVFIVTAPTATGGAEIGNDNGGNSSLGVRYGAANSLTAINQTTNNGAIAHNSKWLGTFHLQRTGSAAYALEANGLQSGTGTDTSTAIPNNSFLIGASPTAGVAGIFSTAQVGAAWVGKSMTAAQIQSMSAALRSAFAGLGITQV